MPSKNQMQHIMVCTKYTIQDLKYIILYQLAAREESGQAASQATFLSGANTKQNQGCLVTPSLVGNTKQNNFLIRGVL